MKVHTVFIFTNWDFQRRRSDALVNYLKDWNVGCSVHFIPLHEHPHYRSNQNEFKGCNQISNRNLSLPMDPGLVIDDVKYICSVIQNFGESL